MSRTEGKGYFGPFSSNMEVANQNGLLFDSPGSRGGFYDFASTQEGQFETLLGAQNSIYWASRLIQGHTKIGRRVILEVGHHNRLSPVETALFYPDTTVVAIDPAAIRSDDTAIKGEWRGSLVAAFKLKIEELLDHGLLVDRVQFVAPDPHSESKLLELAYSLVKPGGQIVMTIDPWVIPTYYSKDLEKQPKQIAEHFKLKHDNFEVEVAELLIEEVKGKFGFSDSKYLKRKEYPVIPVIVATKSINN